MLFGHTASDSPLSAKRECERAHEQVVDVHETRSFCAALLCIAASCRPIFDICCGRHGAPCPDAHRLAWTEQCEKGCHAGREDGSKDSLRTNRRPTISPRRSTLGPSLGGSQCEFMARRGRRPGRSPGRSTPRLPVERLQSEPMAHTTRSPRSFARRTHSGASSALERNAAPSSRGVWVWPGR